MLGRWAPDGSDDYVRTYRSIVRELVGKFVSTVRAGRAYTAFDEEDAIAELGRRLAEKDPESWQATAMVHLFSRVAEECASSFVDQPLASPTEVASMVAEVPAIPEEDEDEAGAEYILVFTHKRKVVKLHKAWGCWRARRREFQDFELVDADALKAEMYQDYCRTCWPSAAPTCLEANADEEEVISSGSSSSTLSGGSAVTPVECPGTPP